MILFFLGTRLLFDYESLLIWMKGFQRDLKDIARLYHGLLFKTTQLFTLGCLSTNCCQNSFIPFIPWCIGNICFILFFIFFDSNIMAASILNTSNNLNELFKENKLSISNRFDKVIVVQSFFFFKTEKKKGEDLNQRYVCKFSRTSCKCHSWMTRLLKLIGRK